MRLRAIVADALNDLPGVNGVEVSGSGSAEDPWEVTFTRPYERVIGRETIEGPTTTDGQADTVTLGGSDGDDSFTVTVDTDGNVVVERTAVDSNTVYVLRNANRFKTDDPTTIEDRLAIEGAAGADLIDASGVLVDQIALLLSGGVGNDTLIGSIFNDHLFGGDGNDTYTGGAGTDIFGDTGGNDTLIEVQDADISLFNNYLIVGHNTGLTRQSGFNDQNASATGQAPKISSLAASEQGDKFAASYLDHFVGESRPTQVERLDGIFENASLTGGFHNNVFVLGDADHEVAIGSDKLWVEDWTGHVTLDTGINTEDALNEYYLFTLSVIRA